MTVKGEKDKTNCLGISGLVECYVLCYTECYTVCSKYFILCLIYWMGMWNVLQTSLQVVPKNKKKKEIKVKEKQN